jgi:hypothetical protein
MDNPNSNLISEEMKMNLTNMKEVFVNNRINKKNILNFMHRCYYLRKILKI